MTFSKFASIGLLALSLGTISQAAHATTITLDLNSLATGTFSSALTVDGFTLTPAGGLSSLPAIVDVDGTNTLQSSNHFTGFGADTLLARVGGGTFTLVSVQMAALFDANSQFGIAISADGFNRVWGINYVGTADYAGPLTTSFQTFNFAAYPAFQNATLFDLDPVDNGSGFAIQSITVSYDDVPVPGALALLGFGLFGLGGLRRKTKAA